MHGVVGAAIFLSSAETSQSSEEPPTEAFSVELVPVESFGASKLIQTNSGSVSAGESAKEELSALSGEGAAETSSGVDAAAAPSASLEQPSIIDGDGDKSSVSSSMNAVEMALFQTTLLDHIEKYKGYPEQARRAHTEGMVLLRFIMDRQGRVTDAWIESGSGSTALDAEALVTIQRAQPLPPIPAQLPGSLKLVLPLTFNLE